MMESRIEKIQTKILVGMHMQMSLSDNRTAELWQKFMPRRKDIPNRVNTDYISMQVYDPDLKNPFEPATRFEKWAAVEVAADNKIPAGMQAYYLKGGTYAVFIHKGPAETFVHTMKSIFERWLPQSEYRLDAREHFEILPENYSPTDPEASEEVWIPIRQK